MADMSSSPIQASSEKPPFNKWIALWIGIGITGLLLLGGINMLTPKPPQRPTIQSNPGIQKAWTMPSTESFTDLAVDPQGKVWGVSPDNGITSLNSAGDVDWIELDEKLDKSHIQSITFDSLGRLWVDTDNYVIGMRTLNGEWKIFTPESAIPEVFLLDIFVDGQSRVWMLWLLPNGWGLGSSDLGNSTGSTYTFNQSELIDVWTAAVDQHGQPWYMTVDYQLMVLDANGNWKRRAIVPEDATPSSLEDIQFSLVIDPQGLPWVGSGDKIYHLSGDNQWTVYSKEEISSIHDMTLDHNGRIWGKSFQGIFVLDPSAGWMTDDTSNADLKSPQGGGDIQTIAIDRDNKLWVAFKDALNIFDPATALSPAIIRANQEAEQNYKAAERNYKEAVQRNTTLKNRIQPITYGLFLIALFGITTRIPKETRQFIFTFPPVQALFIYLFDGLIPGLNGLGFILLIGFSVLSPIINLFAFSWWLNTIAFVISWYALVNALSAAYEAHFGHSLGAGGMILIPSMLAAVVFVPLTALIKLIMFTSKKRVTQDKVDN